LIPRLRASGSKKPAALARCPSMHRARIFRFLMPERARFVAAGPDKDVLPYDYL
jgi:hypothetical protein